MARKTSVSLDGHFADFIEEQVREGHFDSPTHVVEAGLKLLEEQDAALRDALIAGERSGEPRSFDEQAFLSRMHGKHGL